MRGPQSYERKEIKMKREILCLKCGGQKLPQYDGEHNKSKRGNAQEEFLCDQCAGKIPQGSPCYARSIWMDGQGIPYYEWEGEYIEITT